MRIPKQEIRELLDALPEAATLEDIQHAIDVRMKVTKGLEAADRGDVVSQEELEARLARWTDR